MSAAKDKAAGKGGKKGFKLPKLKLPKVQLPKIPAERLARLRPNGLDATFVMAMLLVGGVSAGSAAIAMRFAMPQQIVIQRPADEDQQHGRIFNPKGFPDITTGPNVTTDFGLAMERPVISETAYVHPQASVVGFVTVGEHVYVGPQASIRADEGKSIAIGNESNVQDGVVLHALPTEEKGQRKVENVVVILGQEYAVYVGDRVSLSPQSQVFGPAAIGDDTWIGMQALVFRARVGNGCVLEPRAAAIGVSIPDGRYVPAGMVVTQQEQADKLPLIDPTYLYKNAGALAVRVHTQLADGYRGLHPLGN